LLSAHADAVSKNYHPYMRMRIAALGYADVVNNCICIPFIYIYIYIYIYIWLSTSLQVNYLQQKSRPIVASSIIEPHIQLNHNYNPRSQQHPQLVESYQWRSVCQTRPTFYENSICVTLNREKYEISNGPEQSLPWWWLFT